MANSYREMLYWYGKTMDKKLPYVNTNGWRRQKGKKDGICLNCLDECKLYSCDHCGIKHKCGNCMLSECFLDVKSEFNQYRWFAFDDEPDQATLMQHWIIYKDFFLQKFNYHLPTQSRILNMNKNQKFQLNEGKKRALSVPITSQYLKFKLFGKIYIQFGTVMTNKIQPWLELSTLKIGYLQLLNVERCSELMVTRGQFATNVTRAMCITGIKSKRPIYDNDCVIEAYLDKNDQGWKFSAILGKRRIPVTQKLAMEHFMKSLKSELFYYAHSRCHTLSNCPRWNEGLRLLNASTLNIVFRRQFMNEIVEWFELFSQYTGSHYDFITECVHDKKAIDIFKQEIEDYIREGKRITLRSVVPEEHAAYRYILQLRESLMLAIDAALLRIRSQSMGVL
nr:non-structural protein 1 [Rotavirus C]QUD20542.1 non-structural protein 1 [Rotavirus C]QUD20548.1 non-structural protein 1 [Rotavirus C]QUD20550.1 non-structural protein 1 [Rotavirus C]QUD20552.1 non-structural protein 1 [Rotavirus C]